MAADLLPHGLTADSTAEEPKPPITSFDAEMEARMAAEYLAIAASLGPKVPSGPTDAKRWSPTQWASKRRRRKLATASRKRNR